MNIEIGKYYYHRKGCFAVVRYVTWINSDGIHYHVVFNPSLPPHAPGLKFGRTCSQKGFAKWVTGEVPSEIVESREFERLSGALIHPTYLVLGVNGNELLRCSSKRAAFYLRKGFAKEVGDHVLQFTDPHTEQVLNELYGGNINLEFFLAKKNGKCVVCGTDKFLTKHHVLPWRHKHKLPIEFRKRLSNVLFVCDKCHHQYELLPEPAWNDDAAEYIQSWERHFVEEMKPKHLPAGWHLWLDMKERA